MSSDAETARKIVLDCETRLNAAGADRTKVKYEIYKELTAKGLDEVADLLMTFDAVTRANSTNPAPQVGSDLHAGAEHPVPPQPQPPHPKRPWNRFFAIALPLACLILIGVRVGPYLYTLAVNRFSPPLVPNSHFVGQHGTKKKLIVFVHGVMGDMDNTWLNPVTHSSWPELITADQDLGQFDVFVYGYASPSMGNASTINEISTRFLQQLKDFGFFNNYTEIDFITHSMGGIITKRTLDMLNNPSESPLLQKVHTVIYISVPSNGADLGALASWISQNPQFKGMDPKSASDFLQSVEGDWGNLLRQRTAELPFPRTYSAYETLPTGPVKVVPQLYTSELSDGRVIGFDYNHIDIVKPKDRNAEVYLWAKARLLEKIAEAHVKIDDKRIAREKKLLSEFDFRLSELDDKIEAIAQAKTQDDAGALLMYIWRAARGTSDFQASLPEFMNTHWAGIVEQLNILGISRGYREAVAAIRDLENAVVTENSHALQSPGGYRLLPIDYLRKRSAILHEFSANAWKEVQGAQAPSGSRMSQATTTKVKGNDNVAGNNISGNNNVTGNSNQTAPSAVAPNGVAITGGTVQGLTVNNYPEIPHIRTWNEKRSGNEVLLLIDFDRVVSYGLITVTCDSACEYVRMSVGNAEVMSTHNQVNDHTWEFGIGNYNPAAGKLEISFTAKVPVSINSVETRF